MLLFKDNQQIEITQNSNLRVIKKSIIDGSISVIPLKNLSFTIKPVDHSEKVELLEEKKPSEVKNILKQGPKSRDKNKSKGNNSGLTP